MRPSTPSLPAMLSDYTVTEWRNEGLAGQYMQGEGASSIAGQG